MFLVTLKVDGGGAALVLCSEIIQDPLLPENLVLLGVCALDWPYQGRFLEVKNWSVKKGHIVTYMQGNLRNAPTITEGMVGGEGKTLPHPPGTTPSQDLVTPGQEHRIPPAVDG